MFLVFLFMSLYVLRVNVVVLATKLIVQFSLKSVRGPVWVVAHTEGSPDV